MRRRWLVVPLGAAVALSACAVGEDRTARNARKLETAMVRDMTRDLGADASETEVHATCTPEGPSEDKWSCRTTVLIARNGATLCEDQTDVWTEGKDFVWRSPTC
jgi:hypothetical protein